MDLTWVGWAIIVIAERGIKTAYAYHDRYGYGDHIRRIIPT